MNQKRIRELVYSKYGGSCAYCGKKIDIKDMQIDHFIPILRGWSDEYINDVNKDYKITRGKDDISNYMPSCRSCNFRKGTSDIETFRKEIGLQAERLMATFQGRMSAAYGLIDYRPHEIRFYFEDRKQKK
jgi:5-methylcytosine-specific restriction endonuclease McrA